MPDISTTLGGLIDSGGGSILTTLKDTSLSDVYNQAVDAVGNASLSDLGQLGDLTVGQVSDAQKQVQQTLSSTVAPKTPAKVSTKVVGGVSLGLIAAIAGIYFLSKKGK